MIMLFSVLPMIYTGQIERFTDKVRWPYKISQNPNHILRKVIANIFISRTEQIRKVFKYVQEIVLAATVAKSTGDNFHIQTLLCR